MRTCSCRNYVSFLVHNERSSRAGSLRQVGLVSDRGTKRTRFTISRALLPLDVERLLKPQDVRLHRRVRLLQNVVINERRYHKEAHH